MEWQEFLQKLKDKGPDGPLAQLCALGADQILAEPLSALVEPQRLIDSLARALTGPAVELSLQRHIQPTIERALSRAEKNDERLGAWVPDKVADALEEILSEPVILDPQMVRKAVDADAMKGALAAVIQEALGRFLKSGNGGVGGIVGFFGRSAGKLRDAGRGILGGFGDELERQFQRRVRELLDSSMAAIQEKLVERILSEETSVALGKARARFFRRSLRQKVAEAKKLPLDRLLAQVPALLKHNIERPELRQALLEDLSAILAAEGEKPLRQLLEEAGLLEKTREDFLAQALPLAEKLVASEAFSNWLKNLWS